MEAEVGARTVAAVVPRRLSEVDTVVAVEVEVLVSFDGSAEAGAIEHRKRSQEIDTHPQEILAVVCHIDLKDCRAVSVLLLR